MRLAARRAMRGVLATIIVALIIGMAAWFVVTVLLAPLMHRLVPA